MGTEDAKQTVMAVAGLAMASLIGMGTAVLYSKR